VWVGGPEGAWGHKQKIWWGRRSAPVGPRGADLRVAHSSGDRVRHAHAHVMCACRVHAHVHVHVHGTCVFTSRNLSIYRSILNSGASTRYRVTGNCQNQRPTRYAFLSRLAFRDPGKAGWAEDRLGRLSVTCVDRVQPASLNAGEWVRVFQSWCRGLYFFETVPQSTR
jgi:hypothetical protein